MNNSDIKYAIIGTGAIGGYIAIKLKQANFSVHCLLKNDYEYVKENGLTLITENSKSNIKINSYIETKSMPKCDVIIVTLKTFDNFILKEIISNISNENSSIILMQNGIGMEEELANIFPNLNIIGASTSLKVSRICQGTIRHFGFNSIDIASFSNKNEKILNSIIQDFEISGFKCVMYPNLNVMRWKKLAVNIPGSGLQIVLNASMQEVIKNKFSYKLLCDLVKEVISSAEKCEARLPDNYYEFRLKTYNDILNMPPFYNSMKEDFDTNKKIELESIYGNTLKIAKRYNIEMPLTSCIFNQISYLSEKRQF